MAWNDKFKVCRHCGGDLTPPQVAWAERKLEQGAHLDCEHAYLLRIHACCEKATRRGCVCSYSITCPEHGIRCWGSHD